ncbi:hypothetical protein LDENG_00174290, partial [Lucifuga dentata]
AFLLKILRSHCSLSLFLLLFQHSFAAPFFAPRPLRPLLAFLSTGRVATSFLSSSPFFTALLKLRLAVLYFKVVSSNIISCFKTFLPESVIDVITTST